MRPTTDRLNRRSIRLAGYDYRIAGAYFVTVCAHRKRPVFGRIVQDVLQANVYGRIVAECWVALPQHFMHIELDEWVVMPNHFHGILMVHNAGRTIDHDDVGAQHAAPSGSIASGNVPAGSLGVIIRSFKSAVTRAINVHRDECGLSPVVVWQRNFYERIIRDEKELDHTRRYIIENPLHWRTDSENPGSNATP